MKARSRVLGAALAVLGILGASGCLTVLGIGEDYQLGEGGSGGVTPTGGGLGGAGGAAVCAGAACCAVPEDCPAPASACVARTCVGGQCGTENVPDGTLALDQVEGDCRQLFCNGAGTAYAEEDAADVPDDGKECTVDACGASGPVSTPVAAGTVCAQGGGYCDGGGDCVECLQGEHCASGVCGAGQCLPASCGDQVQNGGETDEDCGGECAPCAVGMGCGVGADCESGVCDGMVCLAPTCTDSVLNGSETDVDCGGSCPVKCTIGEICGVDDDCETGVCQAGTCAAKPTGAVCADGSECAMGYCVDGFCCDEACDGVCEACSGVLKGSGANGVCGPIPAGADPESECAQQSPSTCGTTGACSGAGSCALYPAATACSAPSCAGPTASNAADHCDGLGVCVDAGVVSCSMYACNSSTGSCYSSCIDDAQCASGAYCMGGNACAPKGGNGTPCTTANQCASDNCVDGYCCDGPCSGSCDACAQALGASANGTCTNVFGPGSPSCTPYVCSGVSSSCPVSCTSTAQCAPGHYCNGTTCVPQHMGPCAGPEQCQSGFCVDGVCCNTACTGSCDVCSVAMGAFADGICTILPAGAAGFPSCAPYVCSGTSQSCPNVCVSDAQCSAGYYCSAMNTCEAQLPLGVQCISDTHCASGFCVDGVCCDSACDGSCEACSAALGGAMDGVCTTLADGAPGNPSCGAYLCDGATGSCPTACAGDADCASGYYCNGSGAGTCVAQQANGTACMTSSQCSGGNCVEGICCGSCGAGQWCDSTGTCRDPVVLLVGGNGSELIGASYHPGGSWSVTTMPGSAVLGSDVTISRSGGVGVSRPLSGNLSYATWNVGTEAWTRVELSVASTAAPAISAFGSSARMIYLVDGTPNDTFHSKIFSGGAWGSSNSMTANTSLVAAVDIAHVTDGNAVLVYADGKDIKAFSHNGTSWTGGTTVDSGSPNNVSAASGPTIVALDGGTAELMAVFVHSSGQMFSRVRTAGTWSNTAIQIGSNTTTHRIAVAPLPGGGAFAAYRGGDGLLYSSVYTPGASPAWSTPVALQTGSPLASVPIIGSPAVARGTGVGANAAAVELAFVLDGASADTMHHVRCSSISAGACAAWTLPVQVSTANIGPIAITSRP